MIFSRVARQTVFLAIFAICGFCQEKPAQSSSSPAHTAPPKTSLPKPAKPKLTDKQQHALDLLKTAITQAAGLEPDMRSFVLWHAAQGFASLDAKKRDSLLKDAFLASESVEEKQADAGSVDEVSHVRRFLQNSILQDMAQESPDQAEKLLPSADPAVQQEITSTLIDQYTRKKNLEHAKALLTGATSFERYPYSAATNLMLAFPVDSPERLSIFLQASNYFHEHGSKEDPHFTNDFGEMVVRFWQRLPPASVLDAIDALLGAARENDKDQHINFSFSTEQGKSGTFSSAYQMRLFQLIPILEHLDKDRAEDLLKENSSLQPMMAKYPQGLQSIDPTIGETASDKKGNSNLSVNYSMSDDPPSAAHDAEQQAQAEIMRRMDQIAAEIGKDPKQALADARALPVLDSDQFRMSPRVQALLVVARGTVKEHPAIATAALEDLSKDTDTIPPLQRANSLLEAADLYHKMGRVDDATKALLEATKAVEKLYEKDSDANDPNLAFKGVWPSTGMWWKCIQTAAAVSNQLPEQLVVNIRDPEIAAYERVAYARSLLGHNETPELAEQHKDGGASIERF